MTGGRPALRARYGEARPAGALKRLARHAAEASPLVGVSVRALVRAARDASLDLHMEVNRLRSRAAFPADPLKVVSIDPAHVVHALGDDGVPFVTWKKVGLVAPGDWDQDVTLFAERRTFRALQHRLAEGGSWRDTALYRDNCELIEAGAVKWGCSSVEAFEARLAGIEALYDDIATRGYRSQRELMAEGRDRDRAGHLGYFSARQRALDEIVVSIGRDGALLFVNQGSQHRLAIAKLLGLTRVPARILVRHAQWQQLRDDVWRYARGRRGGRLAHAVPHPDLGDVPHRYDSAAWLGVLAPRLDAAASSFVEVGGEVSAYFAHMLGGTGLRASALPEDDASAALLRRLAAGRPRRVEVLTPALHGGTLPDPTDVVLVHAQASGDGHDWRAALARIEAAAARTRRQLFVLADPEQGGDLPSRNMAAASVREALEGRGLSVNVVAGPGPRGLLIEGTRS